MSLISAAKFNLVWMWCKNIKVWIPPALYEWLKLVLVVHNWYSLGLVVLLQHYLNATASLNSVADHIHWYTTTVSQSSDACSQHDNATRHNAQIISTLFLEHDNEFFVLVWPPRSPDQSNRVDLGSGRTGDLHHRCSANKCVATMWCCHVKDSEKNLWGIFPAPCWICVMKN